MKLKNHTLRHLGPALLFIGALGQANAADAPFYNPANSASPSGLTAGYELYRTIGCPGRQLLDPACPLPPVPAPPPAPKDSDGDGIIDDKDRCPGTPAGARVDAFGCELDSDGDGVVDRLDQCPSTPAGRKVDTKGCELDTDGDGVVDALDRCPNTPAGDKVDNKGCTLPSTIVLRGVNFDNNSADIRADAQPILDDAAVVLKRYPYIKAKVAGHTDSRGDDARNQSLSARRAESVMRYLIERGVAAERLSAAGYGESQPIADNATEAGRFENRRVELQISE